MNPVQTLTLTLTRALTLTLTRTRTFPPALALKLPMLVAQPRILPSEAISYQPLFVTRRKVQQVAHRGCGLPAPQTWKAAVNRGFGDTRGLPP